ncbi:MAG: glycosyltransferase family 2 protein [Rhodothermales bacterium]|nr:glycosyltransferase family 2 protein [Rhodothermales bacterium]
MQTPAHQEQRTSPRVTIGLPVYNGEAFVGRAIDSILGQSFGELELIITDNCSTDATESICRSYESTDPRVRYIRNSENIGVIANFNKVFEIATGEYFKWAASDDICHPEMIQHLVGALDDNPTAVMAVPQARIFENHPENVYAGVEEGKSAIVNQNSVVDYDMRLFSVNPMDRFRAVLQTDHPGTVIYSLIRSSALRETGLHQVEGSDRLLLSELALKGEYVLVDRQLFFRRIHDMNIDRSRREYVAMVHGEDHPGLLTPPWRWPFNYIRTILKSRLSVPTKLQASAMVVAHSFRPRFIRKFLVPGPENYWGITRDKLRLVYIL